LDPSPSSAHSDGASSECVHDLLADAVKRWPDPLRAGPVTRGDFTVESIDDLDEDGVKERVVTSEKGCGTSNCFYLLYLSRKGCETPAGTLYSDPSRLTVLPQATDGVHDLRVFGVDGCAGRAGTSELLRWNGREYAKISSTKCDCPVTNPKAPRAAVCPK
jgi:hypothetical protein